MDRGRADGSFRSDLPRDWLVAAFHGIVQTAGQEVADGRLAAGWSGLTAPDGAAVERLGVSWPNVIK